MRERESLSESLILELTEDTLLCQKLMPVPGPILTTTMLPHPTLTDTDLTVSDLPWVVPTVSVLPQKPDGSLAEVLTTKDQELKPL
jgi:hypothetical protein